MQRINIESIKINVINKLEKNFKDKKQWKEKITIRKEELTKWELFESIINFNIIQNKKGKINKYKELLKLYKVKDNIIYNSNSDIIKKLKQYFIEESLKQYQFCPYCGINELNMVGRKQGFDIEHFFDKKTHKYLSITMENWLLSCSICNRIKQNKNILDFLNKNDSKSNLDKSIFHPYYGLITIDNNNIIIKNKNETKLSLSFIEKGEIYKNIYSIFFNLNKIYGYNELQGYHNIIIFVNDKLEKIKANLYQYKIIINMKGEDLNKENLSVFINEQIQYFFKNFYPENDETILKYNYGMLKLQLIEYIEKILLEDYIKNKKI